MRSSGERAKGMRARPRPMITPTLRDPAESDYQTGLTRGQQWSQECCRKVGLDNADCCWEAKYKEGGWPQASQPQSQRETEGDGRGVRRKWKFMKGRHPLQSTLKVCCEGKQTGWLYPRQSLPVTTRWQHSAHPVATLHSSSLSWAPEFQHILTHTRTWNPLSSHHHVLTYPAESVS